ncbi:SEC-C motif-containing protein [Gracilibacillus ureilyticus]|uniref:SEC-C motif-containing protein n=1 Tax=Gracilibacillus ureilyticus TaxID=531814 RepID=A0A1H9UA06_9BACI|nr:SEC-C metal-binding domain-containing protein [Gracilibacillus ureilyticus]SES05923.1 SEC-C motif-containing protein [Gracilibacillus ureilyticus]
MDKEMMQVLEAMDSWDKELYKKEQKKYWSPIKVPFQLSEALTGLTKNELDMIRKKLGIKNASQLKKADLAALLTEKIPEYIEQQYHFWDSDMLDTITSLAKNNGIKSVSNINVEFFRDRGLAFTGIVNDKKIIALPSDLIPAVQRLKENQLARKVCQRNSEWRKLTYGLLHYYGALESHQMVDLLEKYTDKPLDFMAYFKAIDEMNSYYEDIVIDLNGFSDLLAENPQWILAEQKKRKDLPFYPFTKAQILEANQPFFIERNVSYRRFVKFLTRNFDIGKEAADELVEECVWDTKEGKSPNEVMRHLTEVLIFDRIEDVHAVMDHLMELMNNTREWALKGHTSEELRPIDTAGMRPFPGSMQQQNKQETVRKVGRNEPCPCGSGKKYKKCCGKS